jgi:hypothetical protein
MVCVFEHKTMLLSDIQGCMCAWVDCQATFSDHPSIPRGWVYLLTWWSPKPATNLKAYRGIYSGTPFCVLSTRVLLKLC